MTIAGRCRALESRKTKRPEFPEPEWFAEQMSELKAKMDALVRMAKAYDVDLKEVYPTRQYRLTLKQAVRQALQEAGRPLHLTDILQRVEELGAPAGGRRPGNTLHATLSQDRMIKRVDTNTWAVDPDYVEPEAQPGDAGTASGTKSGGE
jgi:hypothetical protein